MIDTEHETRDEPLLSSFTCELCICNDETKRKQNDDKQNNRLFFIYH